MGAVENARMLLHSGIANSSGFVGRCFSDHVAYSVGNALLSFDNRYVFHQGSSETGIAFATSLSVGRVEGTYELQ